MNSTSDNRSQPNLPESCRTAFLWLGSAEHVRDVFQACPHLRRLYLVENDPGEAGKLSRSIEMSSILSDNRIRMLMLPSPPSMREDMRSMFDEDLLLFVEGRIGIWLDPRFMEREPEFCRDFQQGILDHVRMVLSSVATRATRGWHMTCNAFLNIPRISESQRIDGVVGMATKEPVVVVGAGPSLDRNVDVLLEYRDRVRIVTCDGAWCTLDKHNIVPDLVVSTDDAEEVWRFFGELSERQKNVPIVLGVKSCWVISRHYEGAILFGRGGTRAEQMVESITANPIGIFDSGQCVGHAAFEAASLLGADPVIMMGFDLGYSGDCFHPRDMPYQYFHNQIPDPDNILTVPGIDGNPVRTEASMLIYLREFERRIREVSVEVIDATEGGARIEGTAVMTLRNALDKFCPPGKSLPELAVKLPRQRKTTALSGNQTLALDKLLKQTQGLLGEIQNSIGSIPDKLARDASPLLFMARYEELLDLLSGACSTTLYAAFHFAWTDWKQTPAGTPPPMELVQSCSEYLGELAFCAGVLIETLQQAQPAAKRGDRQPKALIISDPKSNDGCASEFIEVLGKCAEVTGYDGNPDDLIELWQTIRTNAIDIVVTLDRSLYPAAWAIPGCACLDFQESFDAGAVLAPNLLPGYAVMCCNARDARNYREVLPSDRQAYSISGDRLLEAGSENVHGMAEVVDRLLREAT